MEAEPSHRETPANLVHELLIAIATLSRWSLLARREFGDVEQRARALVFLPVIGLIAGIVFAFVDRMLGSFLAPMPRSLLMILLIEVAAGGLDALGHRRPGRRDPNRLAARLNRPRAHRTGRSARRNRMVHRDGLFARADSRSGQPQRRAGDGHRCCRDGRWCRSDTACARSSDGASACRTKDRSAFASSRFQARSRSASRWRSTRMSASR